MRSIFLNFIFLPCLFSLVSCRVKNEDDSSIESLTKHDYNEIEKYEILWNEIFTINLPQYFVYFYSPTCSHCNQIKNQIIDYALKEENMYFVRYCEDVVVSSDIKNTIGVNSVSDLSIIGTPSLINVEEGIVSANIAGAKAILDYLKIASPD